MIKSQDFLYNQVRLYSTLMLDRESKSKCRYITSQVQLTSSRGETWVAELRKVEWVDKSLVASIESHYGRVRKTDSRAKTLAKKFHYRKYITHRNATLPIE